MTAPRLRAPSDWIYRDNGFTGLAAMQTRHAELVDFCVEAIGPHIPVHSLLDLGCGNGLLALQLKTKLNAMRACGVDVNKEVIARATILADIATDQFVNAPISNIDQTFGNETFDLIILMAGRLIEAQETPGAQAALEAYLATHTKMILFYKYDDWLLKTGPLETCPLTTDIHSFKTSLSGRIALAHL